MNSERDKSAERYRGKIRELIRRVRKREATQFECELLMVSMRDQIEKSSVIKLMFHACAHPEGLGSPAKDVDYIYDAAAVAVYHWCGIADNLHQLNEKFGNYAKRKFDQKHSRNTFESYYQFCKGEQSWKIKEGRDIPKDQMDNLFASYRAQPITRVDVAEVLCDVLATHRLLTAEIEGDLLTIAADLVRSLLACLHGHTLYVPFGYTLPFEIHEVRGSTHAMLAIQGPSGVHKFSCLKIDEGIEGPLNQKSSWVREIPASCELRAERRPGQPLVLVSRER
ncbi:MAG: hypothetical protein NXI14_09290 [bacterium]|nr:hypothetical protein [bacterium]